MLKTSLHPWFYWLFLDARPDFILKLSISNFLRAPPFASNIPKKQLLTKTMPTFSCSAVADDHDEEGFMFDREILIGERSGIGQSNQGQIWWHIWRYNLTRHAIQLDTSEPKTMVRNVGSTIKPAPPSCLQPIKQSGHKQPKSNCYSISTSCCHFHCCDKFIPNQIRIIILCHQQHVVMCGSS